MQTTVINNGILDGILAVEVGIGNISKSSVIIVSYCSMIRLSEAVYRYRFDINIFIEAKDIFGSNIMVFVTIIS